MAEYRQNADWSESDHPRDEDGKFTDKQSKFDRQQFEKEKLASKFAETDGKTSIPFINPQLFSLGIEQMSYKELVRSQKSIEKKKSLHEDKISNPAKHIPNWDSYSEQKKIGQIKSWRKEITNYNNQLKRIKERIDEHKR